MADIVDIAAEREAIFRQEALARVKRQSAQGPSLSHCLECGEAIPLARQAAVPGVLLCIECQQEAELEHP